MGGRATSNDPIGETIRSTTRTMFEEDENERRGSFSVAIEHKGYDAT